MERRKTKETGIRDKEQLEPKVSCLDSWNMLLPLLHTFKSKPDRMGVSLVDPGQ